MRPKNRPIGLKKPSFIEQARRKQIVEAAIATIAQTGYAGASLAQLAAQAKISKSVISYHFTDKDELLEETVQQIYRELWDFIRPRLLEESTAAGQLRAYLKSEFAYLESHRAQLLTIASILSNHRDSRGCLYLRAEAEKTSIATLENILEAGQRNGEFRTFALRPLAITIHSAINGALDQWVSNPKMSLADYAQELITIFDLATRKISKVSTPHRKVKTGKRSSP